MKYKNSKQIADQITTEDKKFVDAENDGCPKKK